MKIRKPAARPVMEKKGSPIGAFLNAVFFEQFMEDLQDLVSRVGRKKTKAVSYEEMLKRLSKDR